VPSSATPKGAAPLTEVRGFYLIKTHKKLVNSSNAVREMRGVIIKDRDILGGEPVFRGTRVPFKILIEYLEGGDTLDQFLEQYPSVSRELAIAAIEEARLSLVAQLK
jgi:uncharacterized protein (DUF433 family)